MNEKIQELPLDKVSWSYKKFLSLYFIHAPKADKNICLQSSGADGSPRGWKHSLLPLQVFRNIRDKQRHLSNTLWDHRTCAQQAASEAPVKRPKGPRCDPERQAAPSCCKSIHLADFINEDLWGNLLFTSPEQTVIRRARALFWRTTHRD